MIDNLDDRSPSADELLTAVTSVLVAAGVPGVVASLLDHLQVLYYLQMIEPDSYFLGAEQYYQERSTLGSIVALEMVKLGPVQVDLQEGEH